MAVPVLWQGKGGRTYCGTGTALDEGESCLLLQFCLRDIGKGVDGVPPLGIFVSICSCSTYEVMPAGREMMFVTMPFWFTRTTHQECIFSMSYSGLSGMPVARVLAEWQRTPSVTGTGVPPSGTSSPVPSPWQAVRRRKPRPHITILYKRFMRIVMVGLTVCQSRMVGCLRRFHLRT